MASAEEEERRRIQRQQGTLQVASVTGQVQGVLDDAQPNLLEDVSVRVEITSRIGIIGANGCGVSGQSSRFWAMQRIICMSLLQVSSRIRLACFACQKSTLIKILLGELQTTNGIVSLNSNVRCAYFTQHHVDQLNLGVSAVQWLRELFPGTLEVECRRHLGRFGLIGDVRRERTHAEAARGGVVADMHVFLIDPCCLCSCPARSSS